MTKSAVVIVDMLHDFMDCGALAVPHANDIVDEVNTLSRAADISVAVQDWHPADHYSFAKVAGVPPFTMVDGEMKWPVHCVADTYGADFHIAIDQKPIRVIFRKGIDKDVESYSGCRDDKGGSHGLAEYLHLQAVDRVYVCGLALDYCVGATAKHLAQAGLNTFIVTDATKPVNPDYVFFSTDPVLLVTTEQALTAMGRGKKSP